MFLTVLKPYIEGWENLSGTFGSASFPNLADCWVQDRGVAASYMRGMSNTYGAYAGNGYVEFLGNGPKFRYNYTFVAAYNEFEFKKVQPQHCRLS